MIERAVENWLTKTNERNYHAAFCQVLLFQGHKILDIASHRPMEQGKDIITIDPDGNPCGYQLKTGDIDVPAWRAIRGEVIELMEHPIVHPSIDKSKTHKSYVVTNGELTDEIRIQIDQMNDGNKAKNRSVSYLEYINGQSLLKQFLDAQGKFLPSDISEFSQFLEFYQADGTDFFPKEKYFNFLNKAIFSAEIKQKSNLHHAISSSLILTSYLLNSFQLKNNYYAAFEAWICLAGAVVRFVQQKQIKKELYEDSLTLIFSEAKKNLALLKEELISRKDLLEGDWMGDGGMVYRARATILLGAICAFELFQLENEASYQVDERVTIWVKTSLSLAWLSGESSFPSFFYVIRFLENQNEKDLAKKLMADLLQALLACNSNKSKPNRNPLPNPYYSTSEILEKTLGLDNSKIDFEEFKGSSYILKPLISMLVRRGYRDILEIFWKQISFMQYKEFRINKAEDIFSWRTEDGLNCSEFPDTPQSWKKLQDEARSEKNDFFDKNRQLLSFFVLACPHRLSGALAGYLDKS